MRKFCISKLRLAAAPTFLVFLLLFSFGSCLSPIAAIVRRASPLLSKTSKVELWTRRRQAHRRCKGARGGGLPPEKLFGRARVIITQSERKVEGEEKTKQRHPLLRGAEESSPPKDDEVCLRACDATRHGGAARGDDGGAARGPRVLQQHRAG
jgi:hypothetical protein